MCRGVCPYSYTNIVNVIVCFWRVDIFSWRKALPMKLRNSFSRSVLFGLSHSFLFFSFSLSFSTYYFPLQPTRHTLLSPFRAFSFPPPANEIFKLCPNCTNIYIYLKWNSLLYAAHTYYIYKLTFFLFDGQILSFFFFNTWNIEKI